VSSKPARSGMPDHLGPSTAPGGGGPETLSRDQRSVHHRDTPIGVTYTGSMSIYDPPLHALDGTPVSIGDFRGKALLVVNVASKCGLTPQYEGLERLQKTYGDKGFSVLGFPCNQFGEQEPGSSEEIATFCSATYGVTFPMFEKVEVNGDHRHPVYDELVAFPDAEGEAGDIQWNFEKFLVSPQGEIVQRFRPMVDPEAPEVTDAIEANLPG